MTVADDLATLRVLTTGHWTTRAALDRVEAEIARLERENEHLHLRIQRKNERLNAAEAEVARLRDGLRRYDEWASRMPDAGFTDADPRWQWWHERPYDEARALLAEDGAV